MQCSRDVLPVEDFNLVPSCFPSFPVVGHLNDDKSGMTVTAGSVMDALVPELSVAWLRQHTGLRTGGAKVAHEK